MSILLDITIVLDVLFERQPLDPSASDHLPA